MRTLFRPLGRGARLPEGYTRVKYLERKPSTIQYFDTGVKANTRMLCAIASESPQASNDSWSGVNSSGDFALFVILNQHTTTHRSLIGIRCISAGSDWLARADGSPLYGAPVVVSFEGDRMRVGADVVPYDPAAPHGGTEKSVLLADWNPPSGESATKVTRIYWAKLDDKNGTTRNYIPCLNPQGVPCLYDLAHGEELHNAGTGVFNYEP